MKVGSVRNRSRFVGSIAMLVALWLTAVIGNASASERETADRVKKVPITFSVTNNESFPQGCALDGKTYQIKGVLSFTEQSIQEKRVDLYQHALASDQQYWHTDVGSGDVASEMAKRGRTSVTIDRLGYGKSDKPDGKQTCLSGDVSISNQVVKKLKEGDYLLEGQKQIRFDKVNVIGHSVGALIAEAQAATYNTVDGIGILNWNAFLFTPEEMKRYPKSLARCISGDTLELRGYDEFEPDEDEYIKAATGGSYSDEAISRIAQMHSPTPCGATESVPKTIAYLSPRFNEIRVPVALFRAEFDRDVIMPDEQTYLYLNSPKTTMYSQEDAGHYGALANTNQDLFNAMAAQLP